MGLFQEHPLTGDVTWAIPSPRESSPILVACTPAGDRSPRSNSQKAIGRVCATPNIECDEAECTWAQWLAEKQAARMKGSSSGRAVQQCLQHGQQDCREKARRSPGVAF